MPRSLFATVPSEAIYPRVVRALVERCKLDIEEARFCAGQASLRLGLDVTFEETLSFARMVAARED